jgi:5-(aminomethyl)-3-furanmethanol phosphate kinase
VIKTPVCVVKVGGSLLDWPELPARLLGFLEQRRASEPGLKHALMCGGGDFADSVRRYDRIHRLGDWAAHRLAVQAMDLACTVLFCLLKHCRGVETLAMLDENWPPDEIPMLLPSTNLDELQFEKRAPVPLSWDVTSDTLAAWIAGELPGRSLVLVKSAPLPRGATRDHAARLKLVDPFFPLISSALDRVEYLHLRDPAATPVKLL